MDAQKYDYSVWAVPAEDVSSRLKKLMKGLRSEFGGPEFEPHVTVLGAVSLTEDDALTKFRSCCHGLKSYTATVDGAAPGFVNLLINPSAEVVGASDHCASHFGYERPTPYMPHLSLLYGDLTDDEKKNAQEKVYMLDENINGLRFEISCLQLWKTDVQDKALKSWQKITECILSSHEAN